MPLNERVPCVLWLFGNQISDLDSICSIEVCTKTCIVKLLIYIIYIYILLHYTHKYIYTPYNTIESLYTVVPSGFLPC